MKTTVTNSDFHAAFNQVRPGQFSRDARNAIFSYYEQLEQDSGIEMELDVVAICCDWNEYDSAQEAAIAQGWRVDDLSDTSDRAALVWLSDQTTVLETGKSVVVLNF